MKNRAAKAFTLPEVLIALFVLSSSMVVLSTNQTRSLFRVLRGRDEIERIFFIKQRLYELFLTPPKTDKQAVEKRETPEVKITSGKAEIDKKSEVYEQFKDRVAVVRSHGGWKRGQSDVALSMVSFVLKEQPEKESR